VRTPFSDALAAGPVVLDGGLATELERRGHDLSDRLWSARLLRDDTRALVEVHEAFLRAGARVVTTASYQATYDGFAAAGLDQADTDRLLRRSVELARAACEIATLATGDVPLWVAASVGPYGAMLADGSEYRGDYGLPVKRLRQWHRRRLEILADAGADVLAMETVPCLAEAEALVAEVDALGVPAWLSMTCAGTSTRHGEPAADAFALARDVDRVVAVGANCTDPGDVAALVRLAAHASGKPVVAYPNSGERWDAIRRVWAGPAAFRPDDARAWVAEGARLVGGCCRVGPAEIRAVVSAIIAR